MKLILGQPCGFGGRMCETSAQGLALHPHPWLATFPWPGLKLGFLGSWHICLQMSSCWEGEGVGMEGDLRGDRPFLTPLGFCSFENPGI